MTNNNFPVQSHSGIYKSKLSMVANYDFKEIEPKVLKFWNDNQIYKKAKEKNSDVMVIVLTGFGDMNTAIEALRLDADDYVPDEEPEELE